MDKRKRIIPLERRGSRRGTDSQVTIEGAGYTLWQTVAIKMNALGDEVTSRSVRDHYNNMSKKYRARMAREERSTGEGGSELTEEEQLLEDLIEIEDETEQMGVNEEEEEKRQRIEKEKGQALEIDRKVP